MMRGKEESEKADLNLSIQKTKITASSPITSWQMDGEEVEAVTDFISFGSKMIVDGEYSHEIKRRLLPGRKAITNLESKDITLLTKVHAVKTMICPVVMYGYKTQTIKKTEHQRTDDFKLWCWRVSWLLRVPWTVKKSNQSTLKEINPEYSLEAQML